jgi:hypothetical protein
MEQCANCGSTIGNLETPFIWKNAIICGPCHAKLSAPHVVNAAHAFDSLEDLASATQKPLSPHAPQVVPVAFGLRHTLPFPIACRTCGAGELVRRKIFRMSPPVVAIGFILLVPSILGIAFCVTMGLLSNAATNTVSEGTRQQVKDELTKAAVPDEDIEAIMNSQPLTQAQDQSLTPDQNNAINKANADLAVNRFGSGVAGGVFTGLEFVGVILFFVSGLLGWLLVMRKRVLQCQHCGAVVAAS